MPRRKAAIKREVLPDPKYGDEQITKFINVVMRDGKKSIAERIVYDALNMLTDRLHKHDDSGDEDGGKGKGGKGAKGGKKAAAKTDESKATKTSKPASEATNEEVMDNLRRALNAVAPTVEVKSRRVGGATYQVPIEVAHDRGVALAMRWIVTASKKRNEKTMALRLAAELYDACMGRGSSVKTRDDVHRMAKANQAFAHYRW